ncbi:MAG TPA: bifunctional phosphoribosylaminoimidazolecarboxamide formyltransferase/IMP cyclohydrolase [bacterium]|nr:bifunctional phosphoribosylaminoimidazolecarboxamide formyltransferase/IMP cyclohydrolase [bacterium]
MKKIKRVLISVYDKEGVVEFAGKLVDFGASIISTGGTARLLKENNIECTLVSDLTGAAEILDGRVKTLHPKIHGAILAKRQNPAHLQQLNAMQIEPIDMVVISLYPFFDVISRAETTLEQALENIDIGGPTLVRAAAKNFPDVAVVTSPTQYQWLIREMDETGGALSSETRRKLAITAFRETYQYDGIVTSYLSDIETQVEYPDYLVIGFKKIQDLRYGENPHQSAAFYKELNHPEKGIAALEQLHGKQLSYNNIIDLDAVVKMVTSFEAPCSVIVKHSNPCGVGVGNNLLEAFTKAIATDAVSAFGGIFGFNRKLDLNTAQQLHKIFIEVIAAPDFEPDALQLLTKKKNVRILKLNSNELLDAELNLRKVAGGLLVQDEDILSLSESELQVVSRRQPTTDEMQAMKFAWKVVKWVKSNAVVFCRKDRTIGIGAGQMSRVDSSQFAVEKAGKAGLSLLGTVAASDAFFPFRDGVDAAAKAGATAIIQPGGSVRDEEVIQAADEHEMAMVFTGIRHFRH